MPGPSRPSHRAVTAALIAIGHRFYARGWVMGTSGNFSSVLQRSPERLAITASSAHKGTLSANQILEVDGEGEVRRGKGKPSAETALHLEIVRVRGAGAVLHTHSVWSTILSGLHESAGGFAIEGYEMLKGLKGVTTHLRREWVPVIANDQDMTALAGRVRTVLVERPDAHAFLLGSHGLYTWGATLAEAERHVEILEFLFEVMGRKQSWPS